MCKNCYIKKNEKTGKKMYYCRLNETEQVDMKQLCLYQRFCAEKQEYVLNKENRCNKYGQIGD